MHFTYNYLCLRCLECFIINVQSDNFFIVKLLLKQFFGGKEGGGDLTVLTPPCKILPKSLVVHAHLMSRNIIEICPMIHELL